MKTLFFAFVLCLAASVCNAATPDFTYLTGLALTIEARKDQLYSDVDTAQPAAVVAADRAALSTACQDLRSALQPFVPGSSNDGPDFNYLSNVALVLQAEKDFLYQDMDTHQSASEISTARGDLDYWCEDMIEDLSCFLP